MDCACNCRRSQFHNVPSTPLGIPNTRIERKNMPKYNVLVQLSGNDGNAFNIMAQVNRALRDVATPDEIKQYQQEAMSGDYDNLLRVTSEWVEVA